MEDKKTDCHAWADGAQAYDWQGVAQHQVLRLQEHLYEGHIIEHNTHDWHSSKQLQHHPRGCGQGRKSSFTHTFCPPHPPLPLNPQYTRLSDVYWIAEKEDKFSHVMKAELHHFKVAYKSHTIFLLLILMPLAIGI